MLFDLVLAAHGMRLFLLDLSQLAGLTRLEIRNRARLLQVRQTPSVTLSTPDLQDTQRTSHTVHTHHLLIAISCHARRFYTRLVRCAPPSA